MAYSLGQRKTLVVSVVLGGCISFVSGVALCTAVLRSKKKLKDSYRRIIFIMAIYDMINSFGIAMKNFRSNQESEQWGSLGNYGTAVTFTSFMLFGMLGSQCYNIGLSLYYFFLVRKNYRDRKFGEKIEKYIHIFSFLWSFCALVACLATKSINPFFGDYWIWQYPFHCKIVKGVKCLRGEHASILTLIYSMITPFVAFLVNIFLLLAIWWKVRKQQQRVNKYRITTITNQKAPKGSSSLRSRMSRRSHDDASSTFSTNDASTSASTATPKPGGVLEAALAARAERSNARMRRQVELSRKFLVQACLYGGAFALAWIGQLVVAILLKIGVLTQTTVPFGLKLWNRNMHALQVIINLMVFTFPHVKTARANDPNLNYFQALYKVVKSGCDDDQDENDRRRTSVAASNLRASNLRALRATAKATKNTNSDIETPLSNAEVLRAAKRAQKAAKFNKIREKVDVKKPSSSSSKKRRFTLDGNLEHKTDTASIKQEFASECCNTMTNSTLIEKSIVSSCTNEGGEGGSEDHLTESKCEIESVPSQENVARENNTGDCCISTDEMV